VASAGRNSCSKRIDQKLQHLRIVHVPIKEKLEEDKRGAPWKVAGHVRADIVLYTVLLPSSLFSMQFVARVYWFVLMSCRNAYMYIVYPLPDRSYQRLSPVLITIPREAKLIACHCGAVLISEAKSIVLVIVTPGFLKNKTRLIICVPRKSTHTSEWKNIRNNVIIYCIHSYINTYIRVSRNGD
jgi:hypothetical protein